MSWTESSRIDVPREDRGRSQEFRAVTEPVESKSGEVLLVEAYAFAWLALMAWIFFMWRKQAAIFGRLDGLEKAIDRAAARAEAKEPNG